MVQRPSSAASEPNRGAGEGRRNPTIARQQQRHAVGDPDADLQPRADLYGQGRYAEVDSILEAALAELRPVYGDHPTIASMLDRWGSSLVRMGRREEGIPRLREALAMRLRVIGDRHPDVQLVRTSLGRALRDEGHYAAAESLFTDALRARAAVLGPQHSAVIASTEDLADLALARGDSLGAIRQYRAVIDRWRAAKLPALEPYTEASLGDALTRADSLAEAERVLTDGLAKQRASSGDASNEILRTANFLAETWRRRGGARLARADSLFHVVLEGRRKNYGAKSIVLNGTLEGLARIREQRGDTAGAEPFLREIVANTSAVRPASDPTLRARKLWLGEILCATGRVGEGEGIAREVLAVTTPADTAGARRARATVDRCLGRR